MGNPVIILRDLIRARLGYNSEKSFNILSGYTKKRQPKREMEIINAIRVIKPTSPTSIASRNATSSRKPLFLVVPFLALLSKVN